MTKSIHLLLNTFLLFIMAGGWITPLQAQQVVAGRDSVVLDSLKRIAQFEAPVKYAAEDSVVFDFRIKTLNLYKGSKVDYTDLTLEAREVSIDMERQLMQARGVPDSLGQLQGTPVFKQGQDEYNAEQITYNYQTEKGQVIYASTTQNNERVVGEKSRRNPDGTFYIADGKFTTCTHEHPHFFIGAKKLKMIPDDRIISGPLYLSVADVRLPIIVPFGFFPFQKSRASGLLFPEFGEARDRGYFLRNLGYYWAASPYWDLALKGDLYSRGGYRASTLATYKHRYNYDGALNVEYSLIKVNYPEDINYTNAAYNYREETNFFVQWNHTQKFTPQSSLRANVKVGSANYLRRNSFGQSVLNNELRSSISYQTRFPRLGASLTANLDHQQNLNPVQTTQWGQARMVTLTLPRVAFNKDRIYPFRSMADGKTRWYESIGLTYNTEVQNRLTMPDSLLFTPQAVDYLEYGMRHRAVLNTNLKLLKYFTLTPNFTYNEYWYLQEVQKQYVDTGEGLVDSLASRRLQNGYHRGGDFSTGADLTTNVYGTSKPIGKSQLQFRHTLQPRLGYTYRPDFSHTPWGAYRTITSTDSLMRTLTYSRFEGLIYGGPPTGEQQQLTFGLNNLWEAKFFSKKAEVDSTTGKRKATYLKLVDNLGINGYYNFAADSLRLSLISTELRSSIWQNRINLNLRANHDPYTYRTTYSETGTASYTRIDRLSADGGPLARLVNASFSLGLNLQSAQQQAQQPMVGQAQTWQEAQRGYYTTTQMGWRAGINYTLNYDRPYGIPTENLRHSLNLNGSIKPTENWEIRLNTNYDVLNQELAYTTIDITRNLADCWQMSLNWIPFGIRRSYLITINVRSSTLQDLKLTKRRDWRDTFINF